MRFNKARGIGGLVLREEDFIVTELLSRRIRSFERGRSGVEKPKGPYTVMKLTKKGMTTEAAIRKTAEIYGIETKDIGYAGLKDKFAVTTQYITIKNFSGENYLDSRMTLEKTGMSSRPLATGDLEGNEFEITLHGCASRGLKTLVSSLEKKGMPNYFGDQRFGLKKNNHIIGRHIIKEEYDKAVRLIGKYDISMLGKAKLKFYIHSYQSFLFNRMLDEYIKKRGKPSYSEAPIIGCKMRLKKNVFREIARQIMKSEKIREKDFMLSGLRISCSGGSRKAFVKPAIKGVKKEGNIVKIRFILPKGSYATVLIRELTG